MLQAVEVEIDVDGSVRLLEPLHLSKRSRGYMMVLQEAPTPSEEPAGNIAALQALMQSPEFVNRPIGSAAEIDAYIQEMRDSWD